MRIFVLLITLFAASPVLAQSVPVIAGQDPEYDACGAQVQVAGLSATGDGFLAVRSGPGTQYPMRGKVFNGQLLHQCDQRGSWIGVVYVPGGLRSCNVTSPWAKPAAYTGPCQYGWVHQNWINPYAG